jgi:hypothetical protein
MYATRDAQPPEVSVVITTHNRSALLRQALDCVLEQATRVAYEVVIVDNNSHDDTRQVVERYVDQQRAAVRYVFEPRQGVSHGRNAGIRRARAGLVAFIDDDCCAAMDWIGTIRTVFRDRPEIDCIGGKVLPCWTTSPPAWLNRRHWSPVALTDHGERVLTLSAARPLCLIGANLAVRREVFDRVGLFSPDFSRSEDHEWELRFYSAGKQALYVPALVTTTHVPPHRCTKAYHRRWHAEHGRDCAAMRLNERIDRSGALTPVVQSPLAVYGIPPFLYRELIGAACAWCGALMRGRESVTFEHENRLTYVTHYVRQRYRCWRAMPHASHLSELPAFTRQLAKQFTRNVAGRFCKRVPDAHPAGIGAGTRERDEP